MFHFDLLKFSDQHPASRQPPNMLIYKQKRKFWEKNKIKFIPEK
jgi:hypothetical protein